MTREEAIEHLKFILETWPKEPPEECYSIEEWLDTDKDIRDALEIAIKALEQEPCEDCVSRKRLIDNYNGVETPVGYRKVVDLEVIKNMPSVTPTRKVGKWIKSNIGGAKVCSVCNAHMGLSVFKFCPNCGAEMEGEE